MHLSFKEWFEEELQKDILKEDAMGQIDQLGKKFWQGLVNAITGKLGGLFGKDTSQPPPKPTPSPAPGTVPNETPAEKAKKLRDAKAMGDEIVKVVVPAVSKAAAPDNQEKSNPQTPTAK